MKNLIFLSLFVLVFSSLAYGTLVFTPLDKSVKDSDFIVVGTLMSVSNSETEEYKHSKGILVIEKIISGNIRTNQGALLKSGDKVEVGWKNLKSFSCHFGFPENEKGIWLLQLGIDGTTKPLFPGSMASLNEIDNVKKHLKELNRSNEAVKIVKIQRGYEQIRFIKTLIVDFSETSFSLFSKQPKYPFRALLVILASLSLYYFLYRSKFKIR